MRFHKVLVLLIGVTSIALAESNSQGQPQALPQPPMQAEPQTQSPILSQEQNRLKFQAVLDRVKAAEPNGKLKGPGSIYFVLTCLHAPSPPTPP